MNCEYLSITNLCRKQKKGEQMKKSLLVLLVLAATTVFSNEAEAATCKVDLKNGRGKLLQSFTGWGYSYNDACMDAKRDCRRVKNARYYRAPIQLCTERFVRPNRGQRNQCTVVMKNRRGKVVSHHTAVSGPRQVRGACQKALNKCQDAKWRQGRRGAFCQILTRGSTGRDTRNRGRGRGRRG